MGEAPSTHPNLNDEILLRLNKINKITDFFLSKYIAAFAYIDKNLIVLSATSGEACVPSFFCLILLSGFSFTNTHKSQDCKGRGRAFLYLLTTTSTCFTGTLALAG